MDRRILWGMIFLFGCQTTPKTTWCKVCPYVDIVDFYEGPEDPRDKLALKRASYRCAKLYKSSSCLVKFTRWEPGHYSAMCGAKEIQICQTKTQ